MGFDPTSSRAGEVPTRSRATSKGKIVQDQLPLLSLLPLSRSGPLRHQSRIRLAADPPAVPATEPILLTSLYNGSPEFVKLCLYELAAALTSSLMGESLSSERRG